MIKNIYYIFIAALIIFLVIFEDDKSVIFLRGDKSFRMLKQNVAPKSDMMLHQCINNIITGCLKKICKRYIYLSLKIQEIHVFPSRLANFVNKLMHAHLFV